MHEASLHQNNCFATLTFADQYLPENNSLTVEHLQKFMKRLRKAAAPTRIRFYASGEYGERFNRPHYHLCLFNWDFPDKTYWASNRGNKLYRSKLLEDLWPFGNATIGNVTFESAAYVARYVTQKVTGDAASAHYGNKKPEFSVMSRRPGIGANWLSTFRTDVYPSDTVLVRGKLMKPPRYYDLAHELLYPADLEEVRQKRRQQRKTKDELPSRLASREQVALAQLKQHQREL